MREYHVVEGATCLRDPRAMKMKDSKTIKEYSDKLLSISNKAVAHGFFKFQNR